MCEFHLLRIHLVVLLWSAGIFFTVTAVIFNAIVIPRLDNKISEIDLRQSWFDNVNSQLQINEQTGTILHKILIIMDKIGFSSADIQYDNIVQEILIIQRQTLIILHSDNPPSQEQLNSWYIMDFNNLNLEKVKYVELFTDTHNVISKSKDCLIKRKMNHSYLSTILSIMGILIIQIGITLQLYWKL